MNDLNLKGVTLDTWARTIALFVCIINMILIQCGVHLIDTEYNSVYDGISTCLLAGLSVYSCWKNNSFSQNAQAADELLKALQLGLTTIDTVKKNLKEEK